METELAWAAGFFDGEGHIRCAKSGVPYTRKDGSKGNQYFSIRIDVVQAGDYAVELLTRFGNAVGNLGKVVKTKNYPNRLPKYHWVCDDTKRSQLVMKKLSSYLGPAKMDQFQNALARLELILRKKQ